MCSTSNNVSSLEISGMFVDTNIIIALGESVENATVAKGFRYAISKGGVT